MWDVNSAIVSSNLCTVTSLCGLCSCAKISLNLHTQNPNQAWRSWSGSNGICPVFVCIYLTYTRLIPLHLLLQWRFYAENQIIFGTVCVAYVILYITVSIMFKNSTGWWGELFSWVWNQEGEEKQTKNYPKWYQLFILFYFYTSMLSNSLLLFYNSLKW